MDALLAELERKRKQVENNEVTAKKKYFVRGDLAAHQAAEYERRQQERLKSKGLVSSSEEALVHNAESVDVAKTSEKPGEKKQKLIPEADLKRRLRERGEPIRLFGETHEEACHRLRLVEMMAREEGKGSRNDFKAAMDRLDQAYLNQLSSAGAESTKSNVHNVKVDVTTLPLDEILHLAEQLQQGDMQLDSKVVYEYLRFLARLRGEDLNARDIHEKMTVDGRLKSARYEQTMSYLKPLFRKLKTVSLSTDILEHLTIIVRHLMARDYVKASDQYLQMAIGNAPWPIGVTNPGIHARTGREKISTALVAHVLNDETQRKYIQGLKRLMTYCQQKFPTNPSKSVEYQGV